MDIVTLLQALALGIIEGLTEFIPVSSTGHLILAGELIQFNGPQGKVFEVAIQTGAIAAICLYYRTKILWMAANFYKDKAALHSTLSIVLGFLPAAVIGVLAHDFIKSVLFSPMVVVTSLMIGGIIIVAVERFFTPANRYETLEAIPYKTALLVGLIQCLAMIPGVSRSGATVIGALFLGLNRKTAMEYSFFLAIPTMLGATVLDVTKNYQYITPHDYLVIAVGFIAAFIAGWLVVKHVLQFITRFGFTPFGWYRIILSAAMLWVLL